MIAVSMLIASLLILDNNSQPELGHITRLRLASVLIGGGKLDEASKLLNTSEPGKFVARYDELRGDIFVKQGNTKAAKEAYEKALINTVATGDAQSILQMKLEDLGRS